MDELTTKERMKDLEGDINFLLAKIEVAPERLRDLSEIHHEGWMFMSKSGKVNWKKYFCQLVGDVLTFYNDPLANEVKHQGAVCYYVYTTATDEDYLTGKLIREGLVCKIRIKIFMPGDTLDVSFESDNLGEKWKSVLDTMINMKYNKAEIIEKSQSLKQLEPLYKDQQNVLYEKYTTIIKALSDSGFWIGKEKKIREGYCYLKRVIKGPKKLYVVLYKDFLYFFKPNSKVSINEKPYTLINLRFITACDYEDNDKCFSITTPLRKFVLIAKHDVAVKEWLDMIRGYAGKKVKVPLAPLKNSRARREKQLEDHGYRYSKPVQKYMSIIETYENGKQKRHKLSKTGPSTVGRSSSNDVTLTADKYISRSHFKIIVENNIPFVCDLGQSKAGTLLNEKKITKAPLKPGDIITIGKSDLIFQVKNPSIFTNVKTRKNDDVSFSSSENEIGLKLVKVALESSEES